MARKAASRASKPRSDSRSKLRSSSRKAGGRRALANAQTTLRDDDTAVTNAKSRKHEAQSGSRRAAAAAHNFAETSRDVAESGRRGADEMRHSAERAGQAATDIYSRSARETTQGLEAAVKYGTVLASGMQTFWHEWIGCAQDVMQRNVNAVQNVLRSRSPSDFFAAQSDLLRNEMQAMIDSGSRLSEVSARIANDAARAFGEHYEGGEADEGSSQRRGQFGQAGRAGQGGSQGSSRT
jgi:phasin family protein